MLTVVEKVWNRGEVEYNVLHDTKWLKNALSAIYSNQTLREKKCKQTLYKNYKGFRPNDASVLSSLASSVNSGKTLTLRQIEKARYLMIKYCGQFTRMLNANQVALAA